MRPLQTRLLGGPGLELVLLAGGAAVVAVGAGPARSQPGAVQPLLYATVLLVGAVAALIARGASAPRRRVVALETLLVLVVAVPFTRLTSGGELTAAVGVVVVVLTALALRGGGPLPRAWGLAAALVVLLGAVTLVAPDRFGLLRFAPFAVTFSAAFLLFGGADRGARVRVLRFVLLLAVVQGVLAVVEPFIGSPQLWAPAKISAAGVEKVLHNPLLGGVARSQGTLGHPLALGVLLVVAVALLVRNAAALPAGVRVVAAVPLGAGLLASGSRNSVVLAVLLAVAFLPRWRFGRRAVVVVAALVAVAVVAVLVGAPVLEDVLASGSATHRAGALDAVPGLLVGQPLVRVLTGNGWASSARMFGDGLLQNDGLKAVDDEFVLLLSQGGLVAVALFVSLLVLALRRAERTLLPVVLVVLVTAFVFDVLAWPSAAALTAIALASAPARTRAAHVRSSHRLHRTGHATRRPRLQEPTA